MGACVGREKLPEPDPWSPAPAALGFCPERCRRLDGFVWHLVSKGLMPMAQVLVLRHGALVHYAGAGHLDVERKLPLAPDTIFRMFSLSKPIVSLALLVLYEQGRFETFDAPISMYMPWFSKPSVYRGSADSSCLPCLGERCRRKSACSCSKRPAAAEITIKHLLTHTAGLGYAWASVSKGYQDLTHIFSSDTMSLQDVVKHLAQIPLLSDPGTEWHYGHSIDVVGALIEILSGQSLETFLQSQVFEPLGMIDTGFQVPDEKVHRFASSYTVSSPTQEAPEKCYRLLDDHATSKWRQPRTGGLVGRRLVSTSIDYLRFAQLFLRGGVTESGQQLLSRKTLEYALLNHLPGGADLETVGKKCTIPRNVCYRRGQGFSLAGLARIIDPASYDCVCSAGELAWCSAASGYMWIDPGEGITVIMQSQIMPDAAYNVRRHLHALVYQALKTPAC